MIGIYCIRNLINDFRYIGQSTNIDARIYVHLHPEENHFHNSNRYLKNSILKYGVSNFVSEILEECSIDALNSREMYWINYYRTYVGFEDCKGYNLTLGGDGTPGFKMSPETKEHLSKVHSGVNHHFYGKHLSEDHKRKIKENHADVSGINNPQYGKVRSTDHSMKISLSLRSKYASMTPEDVRSTLGHNKGRKMSDSERLNHSKAVLGDKNPVYGKRAINILHDGVSYHTMMPKELIPRFLELGWHYGRGSSDSKISISYKDVLNYYQI